MPNNIMIPYGCPECLRENTIFLLFTSDYKYYWLECTYCKNKSELKLCGRPRNTYICTKSERIRMDRAMHK